ncbi:hypothetical protein [Clostridium polynesiense]|uniref:hypothetical protein n=1 Tax=Clostridium polynesiense TaxID=1325933 RepID=UPI0005909E69|nr:hypothetical protein [Clostridium polynesiense]
MLWMFTLVLSLLCTFLNPYVGLFGISTIVQFIIYLSFDINVNKRLEISQFGSGEQSHYTRNLKKSGKGISNVWCASSVILFITYTIMSIGVWALASGKLTSAATIMMPFNVIPEDKIEVYSAVLLIAGIFFNLLTTVLVFIRRNQLLKREFHSSNNEYMEAYDGERN